MNLPNRITLARICLIPVFVAVFYCGLLNEWCFFASAIVFLIAASTDAVDGHIARSRHLVTDLGKFLDPIADKVLVSTAFILLLTVPLPFTVAPFEGCGMIIAGICVAVILARELIVGGLRMIAAGKHIVLAADKLGKIKTTFQDIAIAMLLFSMTFLTIGARAFEVQWVSVLGSEYNRLIKIYDAGEILACIGLACFVLCTLFTVVSGINYLVKNRSVFRTEAEE